MELASVNSPGTAFIAGLVTSLHCAGMCGPLLCAFGPAQRTTDDATTAQTAYHVSRLFGYTVLGLVAGALGRAPLALVNPVIVGYTPWILVLFFVLVAFRLDHRLPRIGWLTRLPWRLQARMRGRSRAQVAFVLGGLTPLLPCGPLYFLVALAAFAGSAARGAEVMLAFGLGTVPLLWLAQNRMEWLRRRLSPQALLRFQGGLALVAAGVVSWRLRGTLGLGGPEIGEWLCR